MPVQFDYNRGTTAGGHPAFDRTKSASAQLDVMRKMHPDVQMPGTPEEEELFRAVEEQLEKNGVLAALKAQLRVNVFEAIVEGEGDTRRMGREAGMNHRSEEHAPWIRDAVQNDDTECHEQQEEQCGDGDDEGQHACRSRRFRSKLRSKVTCPGRLVQGG